MELLRIQPVSLVRDDPTLAREEKEGSLNPQMLRDMVWRTISGDAKMALLTGGNDSGAGTGANSVPKVAPNLLEKEIERVVARVLNGGVQISA